MVHENMLRNILTELDYIYRRPKHDLDHLQDKAVKAEAKETLEMLKKAEAGEIELFFVDETTLTLLSVLVKCWTKRDQQKRVPALGPPKWHHLIGAYNWRTEQVLYFPCPKKDSVAFSTFIEQLMAQLTCDKPIVLSHGQCQLPQKPAFPSHVILL